MQKNMDRPGFRLGVRRVPGRNGAGFGRKIRIIIIDSSCYYYQANEPVTVNDMRYGATPDEIKRI
jgi:hypothetical protein